MKALKDKKQRDGMAYEMRMHRQASGGEAAACPANVLPMKGAAVGKDGVLLMVMEEAKGGDLNTLAEATNALSMAGLIPEAARTAMVQRTMQQAVKGLQAVHAAGIFHFDMKALNCLMDADGNVKITDFGISKSLDAGGKADSRGVEVTQIFAPPEHGCGKIDAANEVFWLGSMLQVMSSDLQTQGTKTKNNLTFTGSMTKTRTANADGTVHQQTALDQLRNAMLDPDPAKRPSFDSVLMSSYLSDVGNSYAKEDVDDLMKAVTAYNRQVGKQIQALTGDIDYVRGQIAREEAKFEELRKTGTPSAEQRDAFATKIRPWQDELAEKTAEIATINARPDVAPLLKAVQDASKPFGTQRVPGAVS